MAHATANEKLKGVMCVVGYRGLDVETCEVTRTLKGQGIKHVFGVCMMGAVVGKFLILCVQPVQLPSVRRLYAYWERRQQSLQNKGDEGHP
jgi:hypothetical protein